MAMVVRQESVLSISSICYVVRMQVNLITFEFIDIKYEFMLVEVNIVIS